MPVYLIRAGESEHVKIGWSANIKKRMASIQLAAAERIILLRVWDCDRSGEKQLHRYFSDRRVGGEWFRFCPEMMDVSIADVVAALGASQKQTLVRTGEPKQFQNRKPRPTPSRSVFTAEDIQNMAKSAGLTMDVVCERAGIARSTFTRWKAGLTEPNLSAYGRLLDVVLPIPSKMVA